MSDDEKQMAKACDMQGLSQEFAALLAERDALKARVTQLETSLRWGDRVFAANGLLACHATRHEIAEVLAAAQEQTP